MNRIFFMVAVFALHISACGGVEKEADISTDLPDVVETFIEEEVSLAPPTITINLPAANQIIKTNILQITAQLSDPENRGISEVLWGIADSNPQSVKVEPAQVQFLFQKDLKIDEVEDGQKLLKVKAITIDGRFAYGSQPVFIDKTAPKIEIKSPQEGGFFIGDLALDFTVTDGSGTGLNQILVKANDKIVREYSALLGNISADGKYKETIPQKEIPSGNFNLKISAVDKAEHLSDAVMSTTSVPAPDFVIGKVYSFVSENYTPFAIIAASLQEGENSLLLLTSSGIMKLTHDEVQILKQQKLTLSSAYVAKTAMINPSDSYMDIITAQASATGSSKIVIYLQTESKTFIQALSKEVEAVVKDFVVTDVNGDAYKDIVAITDKEEKTIAVILGSKDGLANPVYYGGVSGAYSIAAGFFHKEGVIDVVVGKNNSDTVSIFKGSGDGEFKLASNMYVGSNARKVMSGDFDAPGGFSDLAVLAEGDSSLVILKGKGNGSFETMDTLLTGENPSDFAVEDFDGDGFVDFAILSGLTSLIAPFFGNGEGKFNKQNWINAGGVGASSIASSDLNGDGRKDLAVLNISNKAITVIYGKEDRKFHGAQEIRIHPEGGVSGALEPFSIAAGRFTGKQTNDLAVLVRGYVPQAGDSPKSAIILYTSDGSLPDGYSEMNKVSMFSLKQPTTIQAADINNDQKLDLVVGSADAPEYNELDPEPSIELMLNKDNNGAFTIAKSFFAGKEPSLVVLADVFQDNYPDVVAVSRLGTNTQFEIIFCFNKGSVAPGEFNACEFKGWFVGKKPSGIFIGKVNITPGLEVLVSNFESNDLTYYPGGFADLKEEDVKNFAVGSSPVGVKVDDLDQDGFNDIITPLLNDITISYGIDNKDNFDTPVYLGSKGKQHSDMIVVDINKDGLKDLVTANKQDNTTSIHVNLGSRNFAGPYDFPVGQGPEKVITSDFNNDGCPDLAVMNKSGKTVTFLVNVLCE